MTSTVAGLMLSYRLQEAASDSSPSISICGSPCRTGIAIVIVP